MGLEVLEHLRRAFHSNRFVVRKQGQQGSGEALEVPLCDARLATKGVAAHAIDRAEHRLGVIAVHERARPIVDRLAGD